MEEKALNEKESLELIAQMIQNTKKNMEVGSGNIMLLWGYLTVAASLVVLAGIYFTHQGYWNWAWFAIPVLGYPLMLAMDRKKTTRVRTYTDTVINAVWLTVGVAMMVASAFFCWRSLAVIMMPLALIFVSIGCSITFTVIKESRLSIFSAISVGFGFAQLSNLLSKGHLDLMDVVGFALGFVFALIIPGHYLNRKALRHV